MAGINKVILVGNLGRDPEVKTLDGGAKMARFTLATTESYKDRTSGERKDLTEWHNVVCWRNLAEIAEKYLAKGKQIYLEGKLRTRSWDDNGVKKYVTEVVADTFTMLGRAENSTPAENPASSAPEPQLPPVMGDQNADDDLPF
ncbi:MAG: single-stranded DNA-binding protein [Bacteroidales bacterium]|nr:single-stranded DNA-binding protein [Bacteroidales bacterium]